MPHFASTRLGRALRASWPLLALGALVLSCSSDADAPPSGGGGADAGSADGSGCVPTLPSTSDAYAVERDPSSTEVTLARAVADRWIAEHPPDALAWDWGDGVLLASMVELHRVTADARYLAYLRAYLDARIAHGYKVQLSDACPPADAAIAADLATCTPSYRKVVDDVRTYLYEQAKRTSDGGISHMGSIPGLAPQLWVDSLYMFGDVLVRAGEAYGDAKALATFDEQQRIFASHLQDATTGFFVHAYGAAPAQDPGVFWGRGNGWALASAADRLRVAKARAEAVDDVAASYAKLAAAVVGAQDATTGLWWTVVNRPGETYLETSASALFAYGLSRGRRAGALDASVVPVVRRAIDGVRARLRDDDEGRPVVTGISGPTGVGDFQHYAEVALVDDLHYGVGAVVLALVEASGLD